MHCRCGTPLQRKWKRIEGNESEISKVYFQTEAERRDNLSLGIQCQHPSCQSQPQNHLPLHCPKMGQTWHHARMILL